MDNELILANLAKNGNILIFDTPQEIITELTKLKDCQQVFAWEKLMKAFFVDFPKMQTINADFLFQGQIQLLEKAIDISLNIKQMEGSIKITCWCSFVKGLHNAINNTQKYKEKFTKKKQSSIITKLHNIQDVVAEK